MFWYKYAGQVGNEREILDTTLDMGYTNKEYTSITPHILAGLLKNSCFF